MLDARWWEINLGLSFKMEFGKGQLGVKLPLRILPLFTQDFLNLKYVYIHHNNSGNSYILVISNNQSFISQILKVVGPLGEKLEFFSPLGFKIKSNFDLETTKLKLHSVRALKQYLNEKNLIHGRETATIWKFSAQNFQTYFSYNICSTGCFNTEMYPMHYLIRILKRVSFIWYLAWWPLLLRSFPEQLAFPTCKFYQISAIKILLFVLCINGVFTLARLHPHPV